MLIISYSIRYVFITCQRVGNFSYLFEYYICGVDDPKAFNIRRHITRIICGFLPAGRRIQGRHILYDLCEGVKTVWHKGAKP